MDGKEEKYEDLTNVRFDDSRCGTVWELEIWQRRVVGWYYQGSRLASSRI